MFLFVFTYDSLLFFLSLISFFFFFVDGFQPDLADIENKFKRHKQFNDRRQRVFSARTYFYEGEEKCDENMEVFIKCIDKTGETSSNGFAAIKVTALGRPLMLVH